MRKGAFWGIPLLGVLAISCNTNTNPNSSEERRRIPVTRIIEKDISLDRVYVADIQAIQNVELRSRLSGFLEKIHVDEGMLVKKGQLLFTISDEEYKAEVSKAKASLNSIIADAKTVELELERVKMLVNKKILSPTELDVAKAKFSAGNARIEEARAALDHAKAKLSYTRIYAPYDGIIDRIPLKAGSLLEEGTLITSVSDINSVFAYFNISENEYLEYLRTQHQTKDTADKIVHLILADGKEYQFPGKIEIVVSEFQENTGSIAFRARFPNPGHLLKHGATGKIKLTRDVEDALVLPQKAAFEIQDKNYVFVVDKANKISMRNFKPKARLNGFYVVESGLKEGETIVYEGIQNIKDGMVVSPALVSLDSLIKKNIL
ncbi:MAG TPA: efflux RND transporter periplasmic adaptor subunit [Flavipsychrobacter sp.]